MKKVTRKNTPKKKSSSINKKFIGVERIRMLRQIFSQLQNEDRTIVNGNPVSLVPVFAMQVLYSLRWGGSNSLNSIMTYSSASIPTDTAIIDIELNITVDGTEKSFALRSVWKQTDSIMKVENTCNGKKFSSSRFKMNTEREKFDNATRMMKNIITGLVIQVAKEKIK